MKQTSSIIRSLLLLITATVWHLPEAQAATTDMAALDSIEISLITCSPHEEVYSLYGHTALRLHDLRSGGDDLSFNYGVFDYKSEHFLARFVLGQTDYQLGIAPFMEFCNYYRHWGSQVSEQVLNLTTTEKLNLMRALFQNYRPENRVYRYNFFYDNCATRPRDIIEKNVSGTIVYPPQEGGKGPSFRQMIHDYTAGHPWSAEGNDLLLGLRADLKTTQREQQFTPDRLEHDFAGAVIVDSDGTRRPLVKQQRLILPKGPQVPLGGFPLSPMVCGLVLLGLALALLAYELKRKRCLLWTDALLMAVTGTAGCLIVVMLFSEHPATSSNLQVLLLNPLHLLFIPAVVRRKPSARHYWRLLLCMVILLAVGSFFQSYARLTPYLALCLLTRYWSHKKNDK